MIGIRGFIERIRFFFSANPKRTKLLGIIFVAITLPLIVITALTVQNLQQKASVSDVVIITDSNGTPITSTADPNVFISITLNTSTQWKLPQQPSSYDGFIKQTYAAGESCANIGRNSCPTGESCVYNSCDEEGNCTGTCQPNQNQQRNYSQLLTSTPTPVRSNVPIPTATLPTTASDSCSKLNPTLYQCAKSCDSLGKEWTEQTSWQNISCPKNSNNQDQQCCYYQPTYLILKTVFIENKDADGSSGGSKPTDPPIDVKNGEDIAHIPWKLNDLLPGQTQAPRTIQVFLSGDGQTVSFSVTVNLVASSNTTPAAPPVSADAEQTSSSSDNAKSFDLSNDGVVNCKDTMIIYDQLQQKSESLSADFDNNGKIDQIDLNAILRNYTPNDTTTCD